jgi:hypothetical protein
LLNKKKFFYCHYKRISSDRLHNFFDWIFSWIAQVPFFYVLLYSSFWCNSLPSPSTSFSMFSHWSRSSVNSIVLVPMASFPINWLSDFCSSVFWTTMFFVPLIVFLIFPQFFRLSVNFIVLFWIPWLPEFVLDELSHLELWVFGLLISDDPI